ncbi:MAG: HAMP domain-containing protein [Nitrospirae bacterium]|nr:HAMP domain-containing protein [Nitrospirota bacterium]
MQPDAPLQRRGLEESPVTFLFKRRVQLSLFFFIPLFLILFSLAPTYITVSLISRAILSSEPSGAAAGMAAFHTAVSEMVPVFLVSGLVALAAGLIIAYALVRPVKRLSEAIHGVATGNLKTHVRLDASGEFVYLGDEFNQMVSKLAMQERLQRTERLAALGTLAAGVAHEVRNPLGAVKGLAQLLCESAESPDQKKYAETIASEVNRLNAVVERLLNLARPAAAGGTAEKIDLNRLIRDAVALSGYERNEKRITIREDYDPQVPEIRTDGEGILQAVLNVLLNAVQAIPETGTIRVETRLRTDPPAARRVRIEIANTNSIIPVKDYRRIFDPFYTTKENGTGLGLAIAHQVVTAQGGTIEVESGRGETVFKIELPVNEWNSHPKS